MGNKKYSDEYLITKLKDFAEKIGKTPTKKDFRKHKENMPAYITYVNRFRYYSEACKLAGLVPNETNIDYGQIIQYTEKDMIAKLKRLSKEINKKPTSKDINKCKYTPSARLYMSKFGSLKNAWNKSGLLIKDNTRTSIFFALEALKEKEKEIHRIPTKKDIEKDKNMLSVNTYRKLFGSLQKALDLAEITHKEKDGYYKLFKDLLGNSGIKIKYDIFDNCYQFVKIWFLNLELSEKEKGVLIKRYGLSNSQEPQTLQEIADYYNLSREGVRKIECRAKRKCSYEKNKESLEMIARIGLIKILRGDELYSKKEIKWALENYHEIYGKEILSAICDDSERVTCTQQQNDTSYNLIRKIDIDTALDDLEAEIRLAIELKFFIIPRSKQLTIEGVCNKLDISQQTLYNRASKGVDQITDIINGNYKQMQNLLEKIGKKLDKR